MAPHRVRLSNLRQGAQDRTDRSVQRNCCPNRIRNPRRNINERRYLVTQIAVKRSGTHARPDVQRPRCAMRSLPSGACDLASEDKHALPFAPAFSLDNTLPCFLSSQPGPKGLKGPILLDYSLSVDAVEADLASASTTLHVSRFASLSRGPKAMRSDP